MSNTFVDSSGIVRLQGTASGPGSASTQTATVTTDPNDFWVIAPFDLGHCTALQVTATAVELTPDGETFGMNLGDIAAFVEFGYLGTVPGIVGRSADQITWIGVGLSWLFGAQEFTVVGDYQLYLGLTVRYLRIGAYIADYDSGLIYAGANHPTAQLRIDLEYV